MSAKLTGKGRFKPFKGKLVLQLEWECRRFVYPGSFDEWIEWRDARIEDISTLDIKINSV